jgi:hypothetical protein
MDGKIELYGGEIHIFGEITSPNFLPWIHSYAHKLGIELKNWQSGNQSLTLFVEGSREMLNCFSLGCSLGPMSVMVELVENKCKCLDTG